MLSSSRRILQSISGTSRLLFYVLWGNTAVDIYREWVDTQSYIMFMILAVLYTIGPVAFRANYYKKIEEFVDEREDQDDA